MSSSSQPSLSNVFGQNSELGRWGDELHGQRSDVAELQAAPAPPTRAPTTQASLEDQLNLELGRRDSDTRNFSGGNSYSGSIGRGDTNKAPSAMDPNFLGLWKYFNRDGAPPPEQQQQSHNDIFKTPPASRVLLGV